MDFGRFSERMVWARFWLPPWAVPGIVCAVGAVVLGVGVQPLMGVTWAVVFAVVLLAQTPRVSVGVWNRFVKAWRCGIAPAEIPRRARHDLVTRVRRELRWSVWGIPLGLTSGAVLLLLWVHDVWSGVAVGLLTAGAVGESALLRYHRNMLGQRLDALERAVEC